MFYDDFLEESPKMQEDVKAGKEHHYAYEDLSQDLFTMLYEPLPEDVESPIPAGLQVAKQAIDSIKELREYQDLHRMTKLDPMAAGMACESISANLKKLLPQVGPKSEEDLQNEIEAAGELGMKDAQEKAKQALANLQAKIGKASGIKVDEDSMRQKMRQATQKAVKDTQEGIEAANAFGAGSEPGSMKQVGLKEKMAMAKIVSKSEKLKEIAKLAGRFTRIAKKKQMEKSSSTEIASIKTGDNLARVLPSEMVKLGNRDLQGMFFKSYFEKTLLEYDLETKEAKNKGPIIMLVDQSGSMSGEPDMLANAMALALCEIAKSQKRDFVFGKFSSRSEYIELIAPKGKWETLPLFSHLEHFFGGGTEFSRPLEEAIRHISGNQFKQADIIFLTDGYANLSPEFLEQYNKIKKEKEFKCLGVLIGPEAQVMQEFCDEVFHVDDLLKDEENDKVHDRIFKI